MKLNQMLVCFVAGKSAGHILPARTIAEQMKQAAPGLKTIFYSNNTSLDLNLLSKHPAIDHHIPITLMQIPIRKPWLLPKFIWELIRTLWRSYQTLKAQKPREIISTGGLISIPVCLIGKLLGIPIIVYELNVSPGKATKIISKFANQIKICFAETNKFLPSKICTITAYPIRFGPNDYKLGKVKAIEILQQTNAEFSLQRKTILVLGGSQGSLFINRLMQNLITKIPTTNLQVIHQIGHNDQLSNCQNFYHQKQIPAIVFSYQPNLMPYYIAADLIICRAGAGTLAEIAPLNTKTLCIPLETNYTAHQMENALATAKIYPQIQVLKQSVVEHNMGLLYDLF